MAEISSAIRDALSFFDTHLVGNHNQQIEDFEVNANSLANQILRWIGPEADEGGIDWTSQEATHRQELQQALDTLNRVRAGLGLKQTNTQDLIQHGSKKELVDFIGMTIFTITSQQDEENPIIHDNNIQQWVLGGDSMSAGVQSYTQGSAEPWSAPLREDGYLAQFGMGEIGRIGFNRKMLWDIPRFNSPGQHGSAVRNGLARIKVKPVVYNGDATGMVWGISQATTGGAVGIIKGSPEQLMFANFGPMIPKGSTFSQELVALAQGRHEMLGNDKGARFYEWCLGANNQFGFEDFLFQLAHGDNIDDVKADITQLIKDFEPLRDLGFTFVYEAPVDVRNMLFSAEGCQVYDPITKQVSTAPAGTYTTLLWLKAYKEQGTPIPINRMMNQDQYEKMGEFWAEFNYWTHRIVESQGGIVRDADYPLNQHAAPKTFGLMPELIIKRGFGQGFKIDKVPFYGELNYNYAEEIQSGDFLHPTAFTYLLMGLLNAENAKALLNRYNPEDSSLEILGRRDGIDDTAYQQDQQIILDRVLETATGIVRNNPDFYRPYAAPRERVSAWRSDLKLCVEGDSSRHECRQKLQQVLHQMLPYLCRQNLMDIIRAMDPTITAQQLLNDYNEKVREYNDGYATANRIPYLPEASKTNEMKAMVLAGLINEKYRYSNLSPDKAQLEVVAYLNQVLDKMDQVLDARINMARTVFGGMGRPLKPLPEKVDAKGWSILGTMTHLRPATTKTVDELQARGYEVIPATDLVDSIPTSDRGDAADAGQLVD